LLVAGFISDGASSVLAKIPHLVSNDVKAHYEISDWYLVSGLVMPITDMKASLL
jgi:hypothetical protein